jgi:D-alanyl-D-alanine carboxypeptidase
MPVFHSRPLNIQSMNPLYKAIGNKLGISGALAAARGLCEYQEADLLVVADTGENGKEFLLVVEAAQAWQSLKIAALNDGIALFIVSAFRSVEHQAEIIRRKLETGMVIGEILSVLAPPGFSEHHTGRAIDISTPDSPSVQVGFDETAAFDWLMMHANDFGFCMSYPRGNAQGYQYEPWHWCFHEAPELFG